MKSRTVGVSPKAVAAVVTAVLSYIVTQTVLDLPSWAVVVAQAALVALAAFTAAPGIVLPGGVDDAAVKPDTPAGEAGYTIIELLIGAILVVVLLVVLLKLIAHI